MIPQSSDCSRIWLRALQHLLISGRHVAPRGKNTLERLHQTFTVDLAHPVMTIPERKLSYKFMVAEAYWILTGDDTVAGIAPYNSHIAQFSDDGQKFAGAYGPRVKDQFNWTLNKLLEDRDTRQSVLVIWRDKPEPSRDIPCTVAISFSIRDNQLNVHVFMRSSDVWLGLPYDIFNFSMLGWLMVGRFNQRASKHDQEHVLPGRLYLTAASSHLYEENFETAREIARHGEAGISLGKPLPIHYATHPEELINLLAELRESSQRRWWV